MMEKIFTQGVYWLFQLISLPFCLMELLAEMISYSCGEVLDGLEDILVEILEKLER
ncbi:MAG: hypothetical protein M1438_09265 [Deltaproteobacteria bacterium]|nr:hypothetical protein [Deltaproteobacteria bacterium]